MRNRLHSRRHTSFNQGAAVPKGECCVTVRDSFSERVHRVLSDHLTLIDRPIAIGGWNLICQSPPEGCDFLFSFVFLLPFFFLSIKKTCPLDLGPSCWSVRSGT
ncbi:hypothetical protein BDV38DRAFT_113088 [Aspergillus pseudotamarii]|uniref:Uncharacterized protein n=1 Tax=Aspergillus pseudotamarii TaxID=132259 RepID=A0A5N6SQT0_ASPPS|nr:uncharacterized protein BDV38DRAFT_113088 [Aspergillus pseudotamarii]KAE8136257.1 hypothetical protein BDV38DRAFT_113088 [Aspergillus pseudotamarii]